MRRYLLIDSTCSMCTSFAHKLCNETENWIHDVVSSQDSRTEKWLRAAGYTELPGPSILEVDGEQVRIFPGARFRWRVLMALGPARALRLSQVIAGDLASAAANNPEKAAVAAFGSGRRRFLRLLTGMAASVSVITGLGFSRFALAAKESEEAGRALFDRGWAKNLSFTDKGDPQNLNKGLSREDLELAWRRLTASPNVERLLSSADFDAYPESLAIRSVLSSYTAPRPLSDAPSLEADNTKDPPRNPYIAGHQRAIDDGRLMTTITVVIGRHLVAWIEITKDARVMRSDLQLTLMDMEEKKYRTLAMLSHGAFVFRREGIFGPSRASSTGSNVVGGAE